MFLKQATKFTSEMILIINKLLCLRKLSVKLLWLNVVGNMKIISQLLSLIIHLFSKSFIQIEASGKVSDHRFVVDLRDVTLKSCFIHDYHDF